LNKNQQ